MKNDKIRKTEYYLQADAIKESLDKFYYIVEAESEKDAIEIARALVKASKFRVKNLISLDDENQMHKSKIKEEATKIGNLGMILVTWSL